MTCVAVDENYDFPRSELAAMAKNIARLIDDIDRLDINRRNMMDELQVLRDVTLFYNEAHPELLAVAKKPATEDAERDRDSGNTTPERSTTPEMQKTPAKTPSKSPAATKEKSPGSAKKTMETEEKND